MIDIRLEWDRPARPPDRRTEHVLAIGLTPHAGAAQLPANLCVLLDCSGSMEGAKLDQARQACRAACDSLAKNDLLSLVTYNSRPTVRFAPTSQEEITPEFLAQNLSALRAEGLTRTELAIVAAADTLEPHVGPECASVLILITDGHPTNENGHNRPAADYPNFYSQVESLASRGITTVTVGLGSARHYNSRFLTELADRGRGQFCYAPDARQLADLLREQIHFAQSHVVKGLEITVKPRTTGVKLKDFCRMIEPYMAIDVPQSGSDGAWQINVGSLESAATGRETVFLGRVEVEGIFGTPTGQQPTASVTASWLMSDGSRHASHDTVAYLDYTAIASEQHRLNQQVDDLRARWDMIHSYDEASRTDSPTRATLMLTNVAEKAHRLGLITLQKQAEEQIDQLRKDGMMEPDAATRTRQSLRSTTSSAKPLGIGFGGGVMPVTAPASGPRAKQFSMETSVLKVIQGQSPGETFALNKPRMVAGRKAANEMVDLDLSGQDSPESPSVSRRHAEFAWDAAGLWVRDLGSSNGTFVNGKRLEMISSNSPSNRLKLKAGDTVAIGAVELRACT